MLQHVSTQSAGIHPGAAYQHVRMCNLASPAQQITLAAISHRILHKEVEDVAAVEVQPCMCN